MTKLLAVFAAALLLAYISEKNTRVTLASGQLYTVWKDWAFILLVVLLSLFTGLRTSYNDTWNYVNGYQTMPTLSGFFADPENLNPFTNPLFYFYESLLKTLGCDAQILILTTAAFTQGCFLLFFKRYAKQFTFSVFIYFTLGTFVFSLAAIKQVTAMAVLTLAFPYLERRKWGRYYLIVLIAMLLHTYAIAFLLLPLFRAKPWGLFTVLFVVLMAAVMMNFESTITAFMEQANDLGKTLAEYEVFDDNTINLFRVAVYAVPPVISLLFRRWVLCDSTKMDNVFIHMSIISFAFMMMGTQAGANMFARMGMYFELGTSCCLAQMIKKTFVEKSYRFIILVAAIGFMGFFTYANAINISFDDHYNAVGILGLMMMFVS